MNGAAATEPEQNILQIIPGVRLAQAFDGAICGAQLAQQQLRPRRTETRGGGTKPTAAAFPYAESGERPIAGRQ